MNPDRWQQIQKTYLGAVALTPEERIAYLETVCAGDLDLQNQVTALLNDETKLDQFLEQTAIEALVRDGLTQRDENSAGVADLIGRVIDDRYVVSKHIGSGGMGDVYRADHRLLGLPVAVKRIAAGFRDRKDYRQRFVAEARRAVLLDHDNIAGVKDVVEEAGEVFVIMEFIDGQTLRKRLDHDLTLDEFLPIATQCASALTAAHEQRIIHLDIKPENIMLTGSNKVKVCDFGVAHRMPSPDDEADTESGARWTFAGTPAYMAPEVLENRRFDARADIFSLGLVFYEMLTGKHPFRAEDTKLTTKRILNEPAPPMFVAGRKLPHRLICLVDSMLAKTPAKRPVSAAEIVHELEIIRRRHAWPRVAWRATGRVASRIAKRPIAASAIGIAVLVAAIGVAHLIPMVGALPLPRNKIVAVLPFGIIGDDTDERLYSEGVSEELTRKLTEIPGIPGLQVVPSSEIRRAKTATIEAVRAEFGATIVIEGTLQFVRSQIHYSYSLNNAANRSQLRTGGGTVPVADPIALQDSVVRDVASKLEIALTPEKATALQIFGTTPQANFLYTRGLGYLSHYEDIENIETAINLFTQAVDMDPQYVMAYAALGKAYWQKFSKVKEPGWLELSRQMCEKAASLDPRFSAALVCIGLIYQAKGDYELSVEYYRRAVELEPNSDDAHRALGSVLEELRSYDQAEKAYLTAIEDKPGYWASHSWIASFYDRRTHNYSKAIEHYQKALALSPDNAQVLYSLGNAYLDDHQYDKAIESLQKSIRLRPDWFQAYANLGLTYFRQRKFAEAVAPMEKAASLVNDHRASGNLARVYWLTGQKDKARHFYEVGIQQGEKLLQLNPRDHAVHLLVGRYYAMLGKRDEARSNLELALSAMPDDPHYLLIAATANVQLGDRNNALSMMEKAVRFGFTARDIREEPELDALQTEPRYMALMSNNPQRK